MKRFQEWLRTKLLKILNLPETYIAVDIGYKEPTDFFLVRLHRPSGQWEVIGNYQSSYSTYRKLMKEVSDLAKRYNVEQRNVAIDKPHGRTTGI